MNASQMALPACPPILLTAREAAKALSVSERTLFSVSVPRGPLPVVRIGRAVRYCVADLQAFIEGRRTTRDAAKREFHEALTPPLDTVSEAGIHPGKDQ
jgi:Helix-turn-helix domain